MNKRGLIAGLSAFFILIGLALGAYAVFNRSYFFVQIHGTSMTPVFQDGDSVVFKRVKTDPQPGHILIFDLPDDWKGAWKGNDETQLIKRVALVPGDELSWDGRDWYRNGVQFSGLSNGSCEVKPMETVLGPGQYFVTGDTTTGQTLDSREAFCLGLPYLVTDQDVAAVGTISRIF